MIFDRCTCILLVSKEHVKCMFTPIQLNISRVPRLVAAERSQVGFDKYISI